MIPKDQLIRRCIDYCHTMVDSMPRKVDERLLIPIWKFLSFIDLVDDVAYLIDGARLVSARIVLRSVIELFYDLQLIEKDINYVNSFIVGYAKDRQEKLKDKLDPNKIVYEVQEDDRKKIREELCILKKRIKEFESENLKEFGPQDKSQILNQADFHKYIYKQLCRETHCNLGELEHRHYRVGKNGGHAFLYNEEQTENDFPVSEPLLMIMVSCMATFDSILKLESKQGINELIENINHIISGEKLRLIE